MNDPTSPAAPAAPITNTPSLAPVVEPHTHSGLSDAEAAKMSEWVKVDVAAGKLTPEQATKMFNELGRTTEQREPDSCSDEAKALDKQFPPAKPTDYTIRYGGPGEDVPMTPELKQFDTTARAWMSGAGLPRELGNSLVNAIATTAQHTKDMTPAQLDQYGADEFVKLQRAYGTALEEKLQAAAVRFTTWT